MSKHSSSLIYRYTELKITVSFHFVFFPFGGLQSIPLSGITFKVWLFARFPMAGGSLPGPNTDGRLPNVPLR